MNRAKVEEHWVKNGRCTIISEIAASLGNAAVFEGEDDDGDMGELHRRDAERWRAALDAYDRATSEQVPLL